MEKMLTDDNMSDENLFDSKRKKKSRKRINQDTILETIAIIDSTNHVTENETTENDDFSYEYLLKRAYDNMPEKHCHGDTKIVLPPPQLARIGTRRTSFLNFGLFCKLLHRQEKVLYNYFINELGTTASIDSKHSLIIRGRFSQTQIESIVGKFTREYVICKICHSPDTLLKKEERLTVLKCNSCQSQYTVSKI